MPCINPANQTPYTMHTILGANGQIATEIARELHRRDIHDIRLVSRTPRLVSPTDTTMAADLTSAGMANKAIAGSHTVYFAVGLPLDTALWEASFPTMMHNVIAACEHHGARLVFFDNTYMYPQDGTTLTEDTPFQPVGPKGTVRARMAEMLLGEMAHGRIEAMICRSAEFYGPENTQSITNSLIFRRMQQHHEASVYLSDSTLRTLMWTPDAGRAVVTAAMADDAYGTTWHLPCDDNRMTYREIIEEAEKAADCPIPYRVLSKEELERMMEVNPRVREIDELLPRYGTDCIFDSSKFKRRFPDFRVTSYIEGIRHIVAEMARE